MKNLAFTGTIRFVDKNLMDRDEVALNQRASKQ